MTTKKAITTTVRWSIKLFLMLIGAFTTVMPLIPIFKEYVLDQSQKPFALKELFVMIVGILLWTGAMFSNSMLDFFRESIKKKINHATK